MSLQEWLAGRSLPTARVALPTDADAYADAETAVGVATRALMEEHARGSLDVEAERQQLAAARSALADVPARVIELTALPPPEWEALVEAHPPKEADAAKGWEWDVATFRPALVVASIVAPDGEPALTSEQLDEALDAGRMTIGELNRLYDEALTLNSRAPRSSTGKG